MKCILDCDPGHDDMAAIMLLAYSKALNCQFISTTHGNQTVQKTYLNARRTLTLIKKADKIPVYRGYSRPLTRESVACPEIHGESGLGGYDWTEIDKQMPENPALALLGYKSESELKPTDFFGHLHKLIQEAAAQGERFQVITTGSMTNIAQYLLAHPEDAKHMRLCCMAGNFLVVGNITPFAEFNVLIDPEATKLIVESEVEVTFSAPLDITHTVLVTQDVINEMKASITPKSQKFYDAMLALLMFFKDTYKDVFGFESPPLHDPVAVFYLLNPEVFESKRCHVDIETKGEFTYGCCCHDLLTLKKTKPDNVTVCLKLKEGGVEAFWKAMIGVWAEIAGVIGQ